MTTRVCPVLLIEDDPVEADLLQRTIDRTPGAAMTLTRAGSLAEGIDLLGTSSFDAVLLDLTLPDSDGLQTVEALCAAADGIPVVVLTGLTDAGLGLKSISRGAQDYLVKGEVDGADLDRAVRYAIARQARLRSSQANLLRDTGDRMKSQLARLFDGVEAVSDGTGAYNETLNDVSRLLQKDADAVALDKVVDALLAATDTMRRHTANLETQLQSAMRVVSALTRDLETTQRKATTDALTGIANRSAFDAGIRRAMADCAATGVSLCLLLSDIDHFKSFNDTWGHQTGDQVLKVVAGCLNAGVRETDLPARYGGEEFAILLPDTGIADAARIADEIRRAIERARIVKKATGQTLGRITMSFGVAERRPGDDAEALIARADALLYAAKDAGRNRVLAEPDGTRNGA